MDVLPEIAVGIVGLVATLIGARLWMGRNLVESYREGRVLRLHGDYDAAEKKLLTAIDASNRMEKPMRAIGLRCQMLRFWLELERDRTGDARAILTDIGRMPESVGSRVASLAFHECLAWFSLRYESLQKAEEETAHLLTHVHADVPLPPYMYSSALYTHGCLLVEEGSTGFALERFSASIQMARQTYGFDSIYAVPPAVALAFLNFNSGHFDKCAKLLAHGLKVYTTQLGESHPRTARLRAMLALVAAAVGFTKEPERDFKKSLDVFHHFGLVDSEDAKVTMRALKTLL